MLVRLLYASRACQAIDEVLLKSILERSQRHNLEHGITGILCTCPEGDVFLQVLDPFSMTGAGALALLEELASTAAIVSRDVG